MTLQVEDHHHAALAEEASSTAAWAARARDHLALAETTVERMAGLLEEQRRSSEAALREALATQQLEASVSANADANRERTQRHEALDAVRGSPASSSVLLLSVGTAHTLAQSLLTLPPSPQLRERVNALSTAFDARSDHLAASHSAHHIAATVGSLCAALAGGEPIKREAARLQQVASSDALVAAVLRSLPPAALEVGVSSDDTLRQRWPAVKRAIAVTASLPPQGGGLISTAIANLAASLKVRGLRLRPLGLAPHLPSPQPLRADQRARHRRTQRGVA